MGENVGKKDPLLILKVGKLKKKSTCLFEWNAGEVTSFPLMLDFLFYVLLFVYSQL